MTRIPQKFPNISDLLKRKGIWLEKKKSQHVLRDQGICLQIAELAGLTPQHTVVEVGAGLGNLTVELASQAGRVLAIEMDRSFDDWHTYLRASYPAAEFVPADFLDVDLSALVAEKGLGGPVCGMGNLPYQITSEILFRFVDSPITFESLVFMVQKEVAERLASGPATRASGALTYKVAMRYECEIAFLVGPECFLPPPKVDSAVIVLKPLPTPLFRDIPHRQRVSTTLDRLFMFRRKTLLNGLQQGGLTPDRGSAEAALSACGIDPIRRPETLSLDEVVRLSDALARTPGAK